jgi:hypothetical protein
VCRLVPASPSRIDTPARRWRVPACLGAVAVVSRAWRRSRRPSGGERPLWCACRPGRRRSRPAPGGGDHGVVDLGCPARAGLGAPAAWCSARGGWCVLLPGRVGVRGWRPAAVGPHPVSVVTAPARSVRFAWRRRVVWSERPLVRGPRERIRSPLTAHRPRPHADPHPRAGPRPRAGPHPRAGSHPAPARARRDATATAPSPAPALPPASARSRPRPAPAWGPLHRRTGGRGREPAPRARAGAPRSRGRRARRREAAPRARAGAAPPRPPGPLRSRGRRLRRAPRPPGCVDSSRHDRHQSTHPTGPSVGVSTRPGITVTNRHTRATMARSRSAGGGLPGAGRHRAREQRPGRADRSSARSIRLAPRRGDQSAAPRASRTNDRPGARFVHVAARHGRQHPNADSRPPCEPVPRNRLVT